MEKHFKLIEEFKINNKGIKLFRIVAIKSFGPVEKGDVGGWIEHSANLCNNAWVYGDAEVFGNARIYGNANVYGDAKVYGNAEVYGNATVFGDARICANAKVFEDAKVFGDARIYGNAWVYGDANVYGNAEVCDDAIVASCFDYCVLQSFGSKNRVSTFFRTKEENTIWVKCGRFKGDISKFQKEVQKTHGNNKSGKEYNAIIEVVKIKFNLK